MQKRETKKRNKKELLFETGKKPGIRKRTILIVDDDPTSCAVLRHILEEKYVLMIAGDGEKAWEIINERKGDISLILLDLIITSKYFGEQTRGIKVKKIKLVDSLLEKYYFYRIFACEIFISDSYA